jgi:uncharacterized protein (TIGR00730 family)
MIQRICVFCGSSPGRQNLYVQAAAQLGGLLAERHITLVYGGGKVGLMGEIARSVMHNGGEVIGIIPRHLFAREVASKEISELRVVESMHERKAAMAELADAFIALPGGLGTLEELAEILTWAQLGLHSKPTGLLDVGDYYAPLTVFLDHMVKEEFVDAGHRAMILIEKDPAVLLARFASYRPPNGDKAAWALEKSAQ